VIAEGKPIANIDFRLAKGTILHGRASEGFDQQPLARQTVIIERPAQRQPGEESKLQGRDGFRFPSIYYNANTDAMGKYRVCLGPGTYRVGLPGLLDLSFGGRVSPSETVVVDSQTEIVHDIRLPTSSLKSLSGKVVDPHQKPVPGVVVTGIY